jgi:hypothetical protein
MASILRSTARRSSERRCAAGRKTVSSLADRAPIGRQLPSKPNNGWGGDTRHRPFRREASSYTGASHFLGGRRRICDGRD